MIPSQASTFVYAGVNESLRFSPHIYALGLILPFKFMKPRDRKAFPDKDLRRFPYKLLSFVQPWHTACVNKIAKSKYIKKEVTQNEKVNRYHNIELSP
jgi:hypothetical protein